ncbi:molybdenum cofactor sulfurase [Pseudorhodoferax aquiterrae]|uniref:Molybdenum cofactor sulfurase n=1 Tax=Pseudorhodoferax aquiterrae TaxID=747304 RepID=A0ABQ3GAN2_9BURK|nr:MOSC domain-containing protein [Pseudorhodoferax aquiterrae]GHC98780.1 molybdenum cofactor sulfurase [Pseudorhodoferax aquiterrae]
MTQIGRVRAVLAGPARLYTRPGSRSAIAKSPLTGPVDVHALGLAGDEQGDLRVHGGPDKAVHCYAWRHYAHWRGALPATPLLQAPGAFGENLSLDGLDEHGACIGDRWQIGSALFTVSQGRQPCWKLNDRFEVPDMARRVQDSGRAGWYLRVVQPGQLQAGDNVLLLARPHADWSIARLLRLIAERSCAPDVLDEVLSLPLPPSWERLFRRRREQGRAEDWAARLQG